MPIMVNGECFDGTQIRVLDLSKNGQLTPHSISVQPKRGTCLRPPPDVLKRLVIVQEIDKDTQKILQRDLDVDEEFFTNHLDNRWWYLSDAQPGRSRQTSSPELPSQTSKLNYVKLRFIKAGEFPFDALQDRVNIAHAETPKLCVRSCLGHEPHEFNQRQALVVQQTTPVRGGYLKHEKDLPVMFAHTSVSAWFKMQEDGGWTGEYLSLSSPKYPLALQKSRNNGLANFQT